MFCLIFLFGRCNSDYINTANERLRLVLRLVCLPPLIKV